MQWIASFNISRQLAAVITGMACVVGAAGPNIAAADEPCEPAWHAFESGGEIGVDGNVNALTVWNGDLIAGGNFATAGSQTVWRIARWDGSAWHPFTSGGQIGVSGVNPAVFALTVWNGDLIVGGGFATAGGQTVNRIARWDGSAWHPLTVGGEIGLNSPVQTLTVWNGDLIAGGEFITAGGQAVNRIVRWDRSTWHPFTSGGEIGVDYIVWSLAVWNGDMIAGGGFFTAGGQTVNHIARWDGSAWHPFTSGGQVGVDNLVRALTVWNGDLIAGGKLGTAGGQPVNHIARWDGSVWHPFTSGGQIGVGGGFNTAVHALAVWNGELIVGGEFTMAGGQPVNSIARRVGCLPVLGACCINGIAWPDPASESNCVAVGGLYQGDFTVPGEVECPATCPADLTGSGAVGVPDLLELLANWGPCP